MTPICDVHIEVELQLVLDVSKVTAAAGYWI
jgi:hypothetical protein